MPTLLPALRLTATIVLLLGAFPALAQSGRVTTSFDPGWRFLKGDAAGAEAPAFPDSAWKSVAVPHDWSIEGPYDKANPSGRGGGYLPSGVSWYRKQFTLPAGEAGRRVRIEFDGVMANSDVWINGVHLGKRPYGYVNFSLDLSAHLKFGKGQANVIAVRTDTTVQPASRYYTGAGIFRHVKLVSTAPVHFGAGGVFVSTPNAGADNASLRLQADVVNESASGARYTLRTTIVDPDGKTLQTIETAQTVAPGQSATLEQAGAVKAPQRWSPSQPALYRAVSVLLNGNAVLDEQSTTFGIRDAKFEAVTGFWLNGVNLKIKGVCLHHDAGALGAAVPLDAWRRRFTLLRQAGVNAIRTSHNQVAAEFLDLADSMGFMVMDETFDTWTAAKHNGEKGYNLNFKTWWEADTRAMILRDRNHPSIILYSVGNEIHDNLDNPEGFQKYKMQQDLVHQLDPTRPVTMALFRPALSKVYQNGFVETMDIVGQNYRESELVAAHLAKPARKVIGTENGHTSAAWLAMRDNAFVAGQFLWVGFDYLGEADWPATTYDQGLFDRAGNWKPRGLQRRSWWSSEPVVHIVRNNDNGGAGSWVNDWTPTDMQTYDDAKVEVYSNAEEVELFLNGQSLGAKALPKDAAPRAWNVTFAPGKLRAVGRNGGQEVAAEELATAGPAARIELTSSRPKLSAAFDDAAFVTARLVDAKGVTVPNGGQEISFAVAGPGALAALDNGDINSHASYQGTACVAAAGKCLAVVKATATGSAITLKASVKGLPPASLSIATAPAAP
ncbi:glycoside hydrolase family 2 TIM barrel-domain containing protein [Massilia sp. TSP1-1-2]|uniref:glycoside hydrolase family 2 TIM barrel-domain containing protein n=1 Tax=Massilia sp. TSP1-1-2 TaxID=2804649 RepID=UPI003CE8C7A6